MSQNACCFVDDLLCIAMMLMLQKRYGVILYSIYKGGKKVNLPRETLTAGPPLLCGSCQFSVDYPNKPESVCLFEHWWRQYSGCWSRDMTVADVNDHDSHCMVSVLMRRVSGSSSTAAATSNSCVTPGRQPVAKRDFAVPIGFNNQWLSLNDRACYVPGKQDSDGRPHRIASAHDRQRWTPAAAATLSSN